MDKGSPREGGSEGGSAPGCGDKLVHMGILLGNLTLLWMVWGEYSWRLHAVVALSLMLEVFVYGPWRRDHRRSFN